jgi:hypothetical protein
VRFPRAAVLTTYLLAGLVVLVALPVVGVVAGWPIPTPLVEPVPIPSSADAPVVATSVFVGVPLALALAVVARAGLTTSPADAVLEAVAAPCLLVTTWTLTGPLRNEGGVAPGALLSLVTGFLLAIVLLADGALTHVWGRRGIQ